MGDTAAPAGNLFDFQGGRRDMGILPWRKQQGDGKKASRMLGGEAEACFQAQLQAFANGYRENDISGQMRNVALQMTSEKSS